MPSFAQLVIGTARLVIESPEAHLRSLGKQHTCRGAFVPWGTNGRYGEILLPYSQFVPASYLRPSLRRRKLQMCIWERHERATAWRRRCAERPLRCPNDKCSHLQQHGELAPKLAYTRRLTFF